jgi:hypothetical protein
MTVRAHRAQVIDRIDAIFITYRRQLAEVVYMDKPGADRSVPVCEIEAAGNALWSPVR